MAFQTSKGEATTLAEINIVPLVDVMLVLLIIFMITAPLLHESIDVDIPEVGTAQANSEPKEKVLTIDQEGRVFLSGNMEQAYSMEELIPKLQEMFAQDTAPEKTVFLRADKTVPYGVVVKIMALCRDAGIGRIGMITEQENN